MIATPFLSGFSLRVTIAAALVGAVSQAAASAGLHQAMIDVAPEMQAMFDALRNLGKVGLMLGFLTWVISALAMRSASVRDTWQRAGAILWLFGAGACSFAEIPAMQRAEFFSPVEHGAPWLLLFAAIVILFRVLRGTNIGNRIGETSSADRGFALVATGWLVALIMLIVIPIACALSVLWNRSGNGWAGGLSSLLSLVGSRYWSLGCFVGKGTCGSAVNSIGLGIAVAAMAGLLGASLALFVHRSRRAVRQSVAVLACLPMITPPFLVGFGLAQLFGKAGLVSLALETFFGVAGSRWFFGPYGIVMAQVLVFFPIAYFMVLNALDSLDRPQIDAAKLLGASDSDILRTVVLPVLRNPLAVSTLVIFVETLSDVGNPLIIGGTLRVLPSELFYSSNSELAADAMTGIPALLLVAIAFAMTAVKDYVVRHAVRPELATAAGEPGRCRLPRGLSRVFGSALGITTVLLLAVYAVIGIGAFSEGGKVFAPLTLDNFSQGFGFTLTASGLLLSGSAWDSLLASLSCALLVAPLGSTIGILIVWSLWRAGEPAARFVENLSSYLVSIPSIVIGAGFMLTFGSLGLSDGMAWGMIVVAMLIRNLAVCLRFGGIAASRIDRPQLEMSGLLGGAPAATFFRVVAPSLRPVFILCVGYGFIRSMTTLGSVLLLSSAENQVATTYIIDRIGIGEFGVGMAYGVVLACCIVAAMVCAGMMAVARRHLPEWGCVITYLRAAIVLTQKSGVPGTTK